MASIKNSILLNYINVLTSLIFPLVTFPYAARVLLPEGIGLVDFQYSIVSYIALFAGLGIPMYAVRAIARCRDDIEKRNRTTLEIGILSLLLAVIAYIFVVIIDIFVPAVNSNSTLFFILSSTIIFTALGVNWFYTAIEEFKYITIRGVIIRCTFAIALFIFVKTKNDLIAYGIIYVGATVGNNLINFIHLRRYVDIFKVKYSSLNIWQHLLPSAKIFILNISISIYAQMNPVMLGFLSNNKEVGLFSAGSKVSYILLSVVLSMGTVMLPRVSNLIKLNKTAEFNSLVTKAYHFYMAIAIPITLGLIIFASPIIELLCGSEFHSAEIVTVITAPLVFIISITNIIGIQVLYPYGKENLVIYSTIGGAIINLVFNIPLIPLYGSYGAAFSTLLAEFTVLIFQLFWGRKYIPFKLFDSSIVLYIVSSLLMGAFLFCFETIQLNIILKFFLGIISGCLIYFSLLFFKRDNILLEILRYIKIYK